MQQVEILSGMMRGFRNRLVIFVLLVTVGLIATIIYAVNQPRSYLAIAVIQIESPQVSDDAGIGAATSSSAQYRLQLIEQRLMARDNLAALMDKYGLFVDETGLSTIEKVTIMREAISITQIMPGGTAVGAAALTQVPSGLTIQVELEDPIIAAEIANDLVDTVILQNSRRREVQARETLAFFSAEEQRLNATISRLENELSVYKQTNASILPGAVGTLFSQEELFQENILEIDQQIVILRSDSSRQRQDYVAQQVALLEEQKALLTERLLGVRSQLQTAPEIEKELSAMNRELAQFQSQYEVVTTNRAEAELTMALESQQQAGRFEILEPAEPPQYPISQSRKVTVGLGGIISVFLAGALLFIHENANSIIRNANQLKSELDLTPVVSIPVIVSRREAFGERIVLASSLALLFLVVPLVALQFAGT